MRKKLAQAGVVLAALVIAAVVFKAASGMQAEPVPESPQASESEQPALEEQPEEAPSQPTAAVQGPAPEPASAPDAPQEEQGGATERQRELAGAYTDAEREIVALLESNVWADGTGTATVSFDGDSMTVTEHKAAMEDVERTWAVSLLKRGEDEMPDKSGKTETVMAVVDLGEEEAVLEISRFHPASGAEQPWKVSSEAFRYAAEYTAASVDLSRFALVDDTGKLAAVCDGQENLDALTALLASVAAAEYPTATKAVWDGHVDYDLAANTASFALTLDNRAQTQVKVLHVLGTENFETDKGAAL